MDASNIRVSTTSVSATAGTQATSKSLTPAGLPAREGKHTTALTQTSRGTPENSFSMLKFFENQQETALIVALIAESQSDSNQNVGSPMQLIQFLKSYRYLSMILRYLFSLSRSLSEYRDIENSTFPCNSCLFSISRAITLEKTFII